MGKEKETTTLIDIPKCNWETKGKLCFNKECQFARHNKGCTDAVCLLIEWKEDFEASQRVEVTNLRCNDKRSLAVRRAVIFHIERKVLGITKMTTLELVYCGKVHYRRPSDHPDIELWKDIVTKNPLYSIRE